MPDGGTDNCETCWFNSRHEGKSGPGDGLPCRCVVRAVDIPNTYWTGCANHPQHNPKCLPTPVGPIYLCGEAQPGSPLSPRTVFCPSPDSEEIRLALVRLLEGFEERPQKDLPSPTRFEHEVIRQLGELRERRALPGLRRVLKFNPLARTPITEEAAGTLISAEDWVLDRREAIGLALEALARILGRPAQAEIEPFVTAGLERPGLPLEVYESLAPVRAWAVRALSLLGPAGRAGLLSATRDPVGAVADTAWQVLGCPPVSYDAEETEP